MLTATFLAELWEDCCAVLESYEAWLLKALLWLYQFFWLIEANLLPLVHVFRPLKVLFLIMRLTMAY